MSFPFIRIVVLTFSLGILLPTATLSVSNEAWANASATKANKNKNKAKGKAGKAKGTAAKSKAKAPKGKAAKTVKTKAMPTKDAKVAKDAKAAKTVTKAPVKAPVKAAVAPVEPTAPKASEPNLTDVSFPDASATGPWIEMFALFVLICLGAFLVYRRKKAGVAGGSDTDLQHSKPETAFGSDLASLDLDRLKSSNVRTLSQQASKLSKHG